MQDLLHLACSRIQPLKRKVTEWSGTKVLYFYGNLSLLFVNQTEHFSQIFSDVVDNIVRCVRILYYFEFDINSNITDSCANTF